MAPWGGTEGRVGTNPWGIVAPTGGEFPIVLDIAITTAGKGMMIWYGREGKKMPLDWALTPDGEETDNPAAANEGRTARHWRAQGIWACHDNRCTDGRDRGRRLRHDTL